MPGNLTVKAARPEVCPECGSTRDGSIRSIEYYADGKIKRVEYHDAPERAIVQEITALQYRHRGALRSYWPWRRFSS